MGSPESDVNASSDEMPQREVTISKPFYMGVTEVTQAQWKAVMNTEPWKGRMYAKKDNGQNAASYISLDEARAFCRRLSQKSGRTVRLPTEAEWEYSCRAGSATKYSFGDDESKLGEYAWYENNLPDFREKYAHPVGQKKPNPWGLCDMHGNLWEWCSDIYDARYYAAKGNTLDPTGPVSPPSPLSRKRARHGGPVPRGGSFLSNGRSCRSANRERVLGGSSWFHRGFRVVLPMPGPKGRN